MTRTVTKYSIISIIAIGAPMVATTFFYFQIETGLNGADTFPENTETREAFFVLEKEFSFGLVNPTEIVIDGDIGSPPVQEAAEKLQASLVNDGNFPIPSVLTPNASGDLALLTVIIPGVPRSHSAVHALSTIRDCHIPLAFEGVAADVLVGGVTGSVNWVCPLQNLRTSSEANVRITVSNDDRCHRLVAS